jgi:PAS domain S-box-containing protein
VALERVIEVVHDAHGRAFLAHPLSLTTSTEELDLILAQAASAGLDGLEAHYTRYSDMERRTLIELAHKHGLLVSAGSDYHGPQRPGPLNPGIDMPTPQWKAFRGAIMAGGGPVREPAPRDPSPRPTQPARRRDFIARILIPTVLAIGLFVSTIFAVILPTSERHLMAHKRETIRDLTQSAWSILAEYERLEREGVFDRQRAQTTAAMRVKAMRYGEDRKDYFWITDMAPRMIMHPYREDLDGADLSDFKDPKGTALFQEFVRIVERSGEGYGRYVWQWKDDPSRLAPKESYVKGFEPWGWIIGTGLYTEDVRKEVEDLTARMIDVSAGITIVIVLLLLYLTQQSLRIELRRRRAVEELDTSYEKYRTLVEAATEGTILVLDHRCGYSNATAQQMLGYSADEFSLLDLRDLFEEDDPQVEARLTALAGLQDGDEAPAPFESRLRRKDGTGCDTVLTATRVRFAGQEGLILHVKDVSGHKEVEEALGVSREKYKLLTDNLEIGVFRAEIRGAGRFAELNPAARKIFGVPRDAAVREWSLEDTLHDPDEARAFGANLLEVGAVRHRIAQVRRRDGSLSTVSLSAIRQREEGEDVEYSYGIAEDITDRKRVEAERESLIAEMQTSLLFLNEPVRHHVGELQTCAMSDPIEKVARQMARQKCGAIAVTSAEGDVVGVVTDHDFLVRVLVARADLKRPIFEVMSAPVIAIEQRALVYEALLEMKEHGIQHLAVRSDTGRIVSFLRREELIRFEHYSAAVLTQEIQRATSVPEIADGQRRLPYLVKTLTDSGTPSRSVTRIITTISDTIIDKLVELAKAELGPPPARFVILALGSEGRGEQTLMTDQDNALIYEDEGDGSPEERARYFLQLGEKVCDGFHEAGYHYCNGGLMAKNPQWNQPLGAWKAYFDKWIDTADPEDMLEINKFFDFRGVQGDMGLVDDLRAHLTEALHARAPFFMHFAQNALLSKPPIGLFGKISTFSIKDPMMLIVSFARLYALKHDLSETNTVDRLNRLRERGALNATMNRESVQAYDYLMRMRLGHQARLIAAGEEPNNHIDPKKLTHLEESMLKQVFAQIASMQNKISHDFGGMN